MGLKDKLTNLREQAQDAVAEHKDQIQGAMETAGAAVDRKTHGKYADKIAKYGQKASDAVESFGGETPGEQAADEQPGAPAAGAPPSAESPGGTAGA